MKARSLVTLWMVLISWCGIAAAQDGKAGVAAVVTPLDDYIVFLNDGITKASGDVATKTAKVEQLKKTVTELEQKQSAEQKAGPVGVLAAAADIATKASAQTEYLERKKELDVLTVSLTDAADSLTSLKKQVAMYEYIKNKLVELEQIMSGAAQMNADDAELAALADDTDVDVVSDADVASAAAVAA
ncbi:MAG: hypothetical protein WCJ17_00975 [bacterium]